LYLSSGFTLLPHRSINHFRAPAQPPVQDSYHPALITFTSGSTGLPKAMGRTHAFLEAQHHVLADHMGMGPNDIDLPTLPVFLLNSLAAGATCVLPDADLTQVASVDPARVVRQMRDWKVSSTSGSPAFFEPVAEYLEAQDQVLPYLRKVFIGGGRVRPKLLRILGKRAPAARIEVVYGSTECEPIATLDCAESLALMLSGERAGRGACVGRPVPGLKLALWTPESTEETDCGEVVVTGAHVNKGYLENPEAEAECKVSLNGEIWHRTGDVATRDEGGRLWLQGRVGQAVNGRYPFPVEAAAESTPFIHRAALVAFEDRATLAVELSATPPQGALEALEQQLNVHIRSVDRIPVDARHNTKIDRLALMQKLTDDAKR
jgi:acyl-coenzyme A synthetase/AMP-(fatty) acid ligase